MRNRHPFTTTRPLAAAAVASTVLLTATACGGDTTSSSSSSTSTLAMAVMGTPNSFAPPQLTEGQQQYIWSSLYDTLVHVDNKGQLNPGAAQYWEYSDSGKTLTLTLRKGMKFSSGAPITSSDVKATLDLLRSTGQNQTQLAAVKSVEAPDKQTVVLRLTHADASLLDALAGAGGVIADPKTMKTKSAALNPVSSGAYTIDTSATVNGSVYVLKRREDYWDKADFPFPNVKIKVISDSTAAVNALKTGEVNVGSVEVQRLPTLKSAGLKTKHIEAVSAATLLLSDRKGEVLKPLGDVRVRKAINMAFDRKKMTDLFLKGSGKPTEQLFHPMGSGYDASLDKTYPYDPAAAKKLLAEAGYPNGFKVEMPSIYYTKPFEPTITQALADIGVKVKWDPIPSQQSISALASKKYPMALVVDGLDSIPVQTRDYFSPNGYRNVFKSSDPELNKLLLEANSHTDSTKAEQVYKDIDAYTVKNAWTAPIFYVGIYWVTKPGIIYRGDGSATQNSLRQFGRG
jgi:peptide/nickel transport system substrate-binding protein